MPWNFELIDKPYGGVSEGPAWDGAVLFFTHIQQSRIMKYDPQSGKCTVFRENTNCANGLNFDREGRLYGCEGGASIDARRVVCYEKSGGVTVLAGGFEGKRFNIQPAFPIDRKSTRPELQSHS